nr:hypothetical protein [Alicyclobacillus macrosporangiidus]
MHRQNGASQGVLQAPGPVTVDEFRLAAGEPGVRGSHGNRCASGDGARGVVQSGHGLDSQGAVGEGIVLGANHQPGSGDGAEEPEQTGEMGLMAADGGGYQGGRVPARAFEQPEARLGQVVASNPDDDGGRPGEGTDVVRADGHVERSGGPPGTGEDVQTGVLRDGARGAAAQDLCRIRPPRRARPGTGGDGVAEGGVPHVRHLPGS